MTDRAFNLQWLRHQTMASLWLWSVAVFVFVVAVVDFTMRWLLPPDFAYDLALDDAAISVIAAGGFAFVLGRVLARLNHEMQLGCELAAALAKASARRDLLARSSRQYFLEYDAVADQVQFPEEWQRMLGGAPASGNLRDFIGCMPAEDGAKVEAAVRAVLSGQGTPALQLIRRARKASGDYVWLSSEVHVTERNAGGLPQRLLIGSRDITARKRIEEFTANMRREMENQHALQVAVQTAAALAHELNQPLSAVTGYCSSALNLLSDLPAHEQEPLTPLLQKAVQQAAQAGRVVHELLEFLQRDQGHLEIVSLNEIVAELLHITGPQGLGEAQYRLQLDPAVQPVHVNRLHVQKVIANLIRNGLEAMEAAGVPLEARCIEIDTAQRNGMARVSVRDCGPGLDGEAVKRIFRPFFSTKAGGIGMGLVTSRALIESADGRMWYEPAAGGGAIFHFTLPVLE